MHTLILGGTREARDLAAMLVDAGHRVTSSLAGRVREPALPAGEVRIGGFGGPTGLAEWIRGHGVDVIVDATHPFAERISRSAAEAATATGVALIALHRPAWTPGPGDHWTPVPDMESAAAACGGVDKRVFLSIGRQNLHHFTGLRGHVLIRCVEPPEAQLPADHELLLSRGPFDLDSERALLRGHGIDTLVTKNSGGALTAAKLTAARELGIEVIMIQRPELAAVDVTVHTAAEAFRRCRSCVR